jgi:hypothetical protein
MVRGEIMGRKSSKRSEGTWIYFMLMFALVTLFWFTAGDALSTTWLVVGSLAVLLISWIVIRSFVRGQTAVDRGNFKSASRAAENAGPENVRWTYSPTNPVWVFLLAGLIIVVIFFWDDVSSWFMGGNGWYVALVIGGTIIGAVIGMIYGQGVLGAVGGFLLSFGLVFGINWFLDGFSTALSNLNPISWDWWPFS